MDVTDFSKIQGVIIGIHASVGNFSDIKSADIVENAEKIADIVNGLQQWFNRKKYILNNSINPKYETTLRKLVLFFIFNTNLKNKSKLSNKVAHLCNLIPQFSKCLLIHVVFNLELHDFYSEAIASLPVEISLELLEETNLFIKKRDAYSILKQTTALVRGIYYKIFHIRYENIEKVHNYAVLLLDKFHKSLQNYLLPDDEKFSKWSSRKRNHYMGYQLYDILNHLKMASFVLESNEFVAPFYQFYQFSSKEPPKICPESLEKSKEIILECNKNLEGVCAENIAEISIDVFCSWVEVDYKNSNETLQQTVGEMAFEVLQKVEHFKEQEMLPQMLESLARKPKTIQDLIKSADEVTLLANVSIENENQKHWYKALLNYGIFYSEKIFNTFKNVIHLSDAEDLLKLLTLINPEIKTEFDLKAVLLQHLLQLPPEESIQIIHNYFNTSGLNNNYESKNFEQKFREIFNKIISDQNTEIPLQEISILVLENPKKFIELLLDESEKNLEHLKNMFVIYEFIKPICFITLKDDKSIIYCLIDERIKEVWPQSNTETCVIQLIIFLITKDYLPNLNLIDLLNEFSDNDLIKAVFLCQILKKLPLTKIPSNEFIPIILNLYSLLTNNRWNFFNYSKEKLTFVSELITLIYYYKKEIPYELKYDFINECINFEKKIDLYHLQLTDDMMNNFLSFASEGFDKNSRHHEQVCRLLKLLPSCVPKEWELTAQFLIKDKDPVTVFQLFIDTMLILTEMSKKSAPNHSSLSYCFQQFCIVTKDIIYPLIQNKESEKKVIKNICRLVKRLPGELQNTIEISLVNLFQTETLKEMKSDEEFVYSLVPISSLDFCKMICSKMAD